MISRRSTLALIAAGAIGIPGFARAADPAPVCIDPAKLTLGQRSQRRSLGYADPSADPKKRCGTCAFFTGTTSGCGTCQLMTGAPVGAAALCRSYAPKGA